MSTIVWPTSLPQAPLQTGYRQEEAAGAIRQDMPVGPVNVRKRTASEYRKVSIEILFTKAELNTFIYFFEITLRQGVLPFTWTDHVFGGNKVYRFLEPPSWVPYGHELKASFKLEMKVRG